jgi:trehalose 6-phosphate phosphatase
VLFLGDDVTDETAFARLKSGDVGVKVGDGDTAAEFRVGAPEDVTALLEALLAARMGLPSSHG